ncbi:orotate phosphoribosyltransferase [Candidatus Pelagibacter sp.]|jgi:orotate phosphoribosyltransferase|nr:orotate phosphoribosyltransferase [Candidatus Pelagibacter sp.]
MLSLKDSLAVLKKTKALLEGHFVLSSGLHSPQYVQCAKLLSYPKKSEEFCKSLSTKIKKKFKKIDIILSPAMGGIVIGYIVGNLLNKETIFCERVNGKFILRRGFSIKKNSKVLIVEDVITTGKSSLECARLVKKYKSKVVGYACLINRSSKPSLKIKDKNIVSQIKLEIPTYKKNDLPIELKKIPITKPGSRYLK